MIVAVVGCGGWGERVARRLAEFDDVLVSAVFDADFVRARRVGIDLGVEALKDFAQYLDVMTPDGVVIATPPGMRDAYVDAVCGQGRVRKQRVRVEKPLGGSVAEAARIATRCEAAGVELTTGFTLLHHPLYDAVFEYIRAAKLTPCAVSGLRIGREPRHDEPARVDAGIHAASVAAYLGVEAHIEAFYHPAASARETRIYLEDGDCIRVDEIALEAHTPDGVIRVAEQHDALGCDLRAWIDGKHRGTPDVALAAQELVEPRWVVAA